VRDSRGAISLTLLSVAEVLAMAVWFSASAVLPQLQTEWELTSGQAAWITMSLQLGFVVGALFSAILNLPDRFSSRKVFVVGALGAAVTNAAVPVLGTYPLLLVARFLTGAMLAGVYPPGMKIVASWTTAGRGLAIGVLVGALTLGSAVPHLLNLIPDEGAIGMPDWEIVLAVTSVMALAAAVIVGLWVRQGPHLPESAPFKWEYFGKVLSHRPTRLANLGYIGHMWELYAVWVWVPMLLIETYQNAEWPLAGARVAGFGVVAIGALGCVAAGLLADRQGRTTVAIVSLAISGACCLSVGPLIDNPVLLTAVSLVWGFWVVADSAQFSAAITELADSRYVGTALTLQTSIGFLVTIVSIRAVPLFVDHFSWAAAFALLALGPILGIWSMMRLRRTPEAFRMASGNR
jgi:MFS family permease